VAYSPRLTARFLAQRKALHIEARSSASRALAVQIATLCAVDVLPEPHHRSRIAPDPDDDRGVDLLADIVTRRCSCRNHQVSAVERIRLAPLGAVQGHE
jgi:hypothetical protein